MQPTLLKGDFIIVDKLPKTTERVDRKDIIIFPLPDKSAKPFVKRVIGLPGDQIEIKEKKLYINGNFIEEDYIVHLDNNMESYRDNYGPTVVPGGALFLLGDNRDFSYDSRMFGLIDSRTIIGKVKWIYWSWDKEKLRVRWSRIGKSVTE